MNEPLFAVRPAVEADIPAVGAINGYYVLNTVTTFRFTLATNQELLEDFRNITKEGLPYLVATEKSIKHYCGLLLHSQIQAC